MRILVVGASGYVGGRLVPLLAKRGEDVSVAGRDPNGLAERFPNDRVVGLDLMDSATFRPARAGTGAGEHASQVATQERSE